MTDVSHEAMDYLHRCLEDNGTARARAATPRPTALKATTLRRSGADVDRAARARASAPRRDGRRSAVPPDNNLADERAVGDAAAVPASTGA